MCISPGCAPSATGRCSVQVLTINCIFNKMPLIPPVSITRSVSDLTVKEIRSSPSTMNESSKEDRGGSGKGRIAMNITHLGNKEQLKSSAAAKAGGGGKRRDSSKGPKQRADKVVVSSACQQQQNEEGVHFSLTLTPEAVLLLQRKSSMRAHQGHGGGATETRPSGRLQDARSKGRCTWSHQGNSRVSGGNSKDVDICSILTVSLLNDRHKYDDVEYEDEVYPLDQRVMLKCTEWLRGLESPLIRAPTTGNGGANS